MADQPHPEIIIVKRKGGGEDAHHGGAWKIAFADFMTAMMAFFLVLWIINATDKDTKTVIARYFNPVKLENPARATKGVHGMDTSQKVQTDETAGVEAPGSAPAPETKEAKASSEGAPTNATPKKEKMAKAAARPDSSVPIDVKATTSEFAIFSDPYMTIDRIAGGRAALSPSPSRETGSADPARDAGMTSIDSYRDPFKPIGAGPVSDAIPVIADSVPARAPRAASDATALEVYGGLAGTTAPPPPTLSPTPAPNAIPTPTPAAAATATPTPTSTPDAKAAEAKASQAKAPAPVPTPETPANGAAEALSKELARKLGALANSPASPAIDVQATKEGLLISLTDRLTYSMFAVGSAEPRPEVIEAMDAIARSLKGRPGEIVLRGHTDGRPYRTSTYDNWRLSSARAQMAYYMLTRDGIPETRIARVEGYADHELRDPAHPLAAENRRIEILLREPKT